MNLNFFKLPVLIVFIFCCAFNVAAQNENKNDKNNKKLISEITEFRAKLSKAIEKRDWAILETLFTDDFTHTHAVGKMDGKSARIDSILSGDKTLESATPDEIAIRFYGKNTAVAVGQSTIDNTVYRWTITYIKEKKGWRAAASQASKKT